MPSAFSITVPTNSIQLDQQRRSEAAFTVYNASGRTLRARAQLAAQPPEARDWLTLNGQPERAFPIAGTVQYSVSIAVPPTAPPGSYTFHLDVVGEENPNEDFTEGPTVTFEVPEPVIEEKRPFPWWIVAVAAAVLAVIVAGYFIFFGGGAVPVPDVAGQTFTDAVAALQEEGFMVEDETLAEASEGVAVGSVIRTEPAAGDEVEEGAAVTLVLSTGPPTETVPDVAGQPLDDAINALEGAGFIIVEEALEEPSEEVAAGSVIRTDPAAGEDVEGGAAVLLVVSTGSAFVNVPDVTGQSQEDAVAALEEAGLTTGDSQEQGEPSEEIAVDLVTRTNPATGERVEKGSAVRIFVSTGSAFVNVPDVAGQLPGDAVVALEGAELTVGETREEASAEIPAGSVIRTEPAAEQAVEKGSTVRLFVSAGPEMVIIPRVRDLPPSEATAKLASGGVLVRETAETSDEAVQPGLVVDTNPPAGSLVQKDSETILLISTGPFGSVMADFLGTWVPVEGQPPLRQMVIQRESDSVVSLQFSFDPAQVSNNQFFLEELPPVLADFSPGSFSVVANLGSDLVDMSTGIGVADGSTRRLRVGMTVTADIGFIGQITLVNGTFVMRRQL